MVVCIIQLCLYSSFVPFLWGKKGFVLENSLVVTENSLIITCPQMPLYAIASSF